MVTFADAIAEGLKGVVCGLLAGADSATRAVDGLGIPAGPNIAAGLRRQLCNGDPSTDPVVFPPPFTGGQCVGVQYTQIALGLFDPPFSNTELPINVFGPIRGRRIIPTGESSVRFEVDASNSSGTPTTFTTTNGQSLARSAWGNLTRVDGLPDNCGDPPPIRPPNPVNPIDIDITFDTDIGPITLNVEGDFFPIQVDIDGRFFAPVRINVGDVSFSGELTLSPSFEVNITPTGGGGPGKVDDPDVEDELDDPAIPPDIPEDQTTPIVGVLVYSSLDADIAPTGIFFDNGPNIYVPRVASVQFAIRTQNSIAWTSDQDVKNLECYVPCPAPQGAIAARVQPQPGVTSRFTVVRGNALTRFA